MKQFLLFSMTLWTFCLSGQMGPCSIEGGDKSSEMHFRLDRLPENYSLGVPGPNNYWVFSSLQSPRTSSYRYVKASEGNFYNQFNDAAMVLLYPDGKEAYFMNRSGKWYELGYAFPRQDQEGSDVIRYSVPINACPPASEDRLTTYRTSYIKDNVEYAIHIDDIRDASGFLYLSDATYDADRIQRIKTTTIGELISTEISYLFVDQLTNELLMEVKMNNEDQIKTILYKAQEADPGTIPMSQSNHFLLYPDVGYGDIRLEFNNFNPGAYSFVVFDIIGRRLWSKVYQINGDITIKEDLSFLPKGRYHYTIIDSNQNKVVTRRLAIIKS